MNFISWLLTALRQNKVHNNSIIAPDEPMPEFPRLHLACGYNLIPGWINTDFLPLEGTTFLDFTKRFPYADNSFDAAFCEHSIEHIDKSEAKFMCAEIFRVLRSGGYFRIVTPSLEKMAAMALSEQASDTQHYLKWYRGFVKDENASVSDAVNAMFYKHGHQHLFMCSELAEILKNIGFSTIRFFEPDKYGAPVFQGVDGHGKVIGYDINAMEAFALEAEKN